jgi:hypothetical protein
VRPFIFSVASLILSIAFQLTLAKYGTEVPDWGLLILWVLPLAPFGWWLWTHDKVLSRRDKLKHYFQLHPWRSVAVSVATLLIVAACLAGIGYTGWRIVKAEKSKSQKPELSHEQANVAVEPAAPTQEKRPPISTAQGVKGKPIKPTTLLDLFKKDFTGVVSLSGNGFDLQDATGQVGAHVDWRVLMDFTAKSKFIAFYVPAVNDEVPVCLALIDKVQPIMDDLLQHLDASGGFTGESTSLRELTFSGRVFIYHEWPLSNKQKADILEAYSAKGMDVQFRGVDYLSSHSAPSAKTQQDNSVHVDNGSKIDQQSNGGCSPNIVGGANTVNCGAPPVKLEYSFQTLLTTDKALFGFDRSICPIVSRLRIVPNQSVPPPIRVVLDFDQPISNIATTIENVGATMGGGPYRLGLHAISSPISPGIGPHHPLIVEVCSDTVVKLTGEPHLVD